MAFWHGRILPGRSTSAAGASSSSRARTSTASGSPASSSGSATARRADPRRAAGLKALLQLKRDMAAGRPAAFTVDGPRGPARVAQPGAVWLAKATGNPVLPFHLEASRHWTLASWDRTQIPKPFATVALSRSASRSTYRRTPMTMDSKRPGRTLQQRLHGPRVPRPRRCLTDPSSIAQLPNALLILVRPNRFAEHQTPPGHPEAPERAEVMDRVAARWRDAGGEVVAPGPATREALARVHDEQYLDALRRPPDEPPRSIPTRSRRPRRTRSRCSRPARPWTRGRLTAGKRRRRSRWCARRDTMPSAPGPWGSASTTTWPSPRRMRARSALARGDRRLRRAPRQRHAAHVRARSDGPVRLDAPVSRTTRARAAPTRSARTRARASRQRAARGRRGRRGLPPGVRELVLPVLRQFAPDVLLVSAGFDAHERDPLGGMRLTTREPSRR